MGEIADLGREVFRDFVVDGVPASGVNEPEKARARQLTELIDRRVAAASANLTEYDTLADLIASGQSTGLAFVTRNNGSVNDAANGVYQLNGSGGWEKADWYFQSVSGVVQPITDAAIAAAQDAERAAAAAGEVVATSAQDTPITLMQRPHVTQYLLSANRAGVALGLTVGGDYLGAAGVITGMRMALQKSAALHHLTLKAWKRPASTPSGSKAADPGELGTDVLLWTQTVNAPDIPLIVADTAPRAVDLTFASAIDLGSQFGAGDILMIAVSAFNSSNADTALGYGLDGPATTLPVHERGWYAEVGTGTNWTGLPTNYSPAYTLLGRNVSLKPVLNKLDSRTEATASVLTVADTLLIQRSAVGGYGNISTYGGFAFAFTAADIGPSQQCDGVSFDLAVGAGASTLEVALYRRPAAYSATLEPGVVTDVLLEKRTYTVAELGLTPGSPGLVRVRHMFTGGWATPATGFDLMTVQAKKADGTSAAMDFNRASQSGWTTDRKGWFRPNITTGGWSTVGTFANAFSLLREGFTLPASPERELPVGYDEIESATVSVLGNVVSVEVALTRLGISSRITGSLTIPLPPAIPVAGEAINISRAASLAYGIVTAAGRLIYPGVTALSIPGLTEGVHYEVNYDLGAVRHLTADDVSVTASYTGSQMAVDAIVLNRSNMTLSVIQGPLRGRDALEKRAVVTGPEQAVVAWVVRTQRGLKAASVLFGGVTKRARDEKNRRILARLKAKMARGEAINWAGYGDSITQMGGNPDLVSATTAPNGSRDIGLSYLNPNGAGIQSDITDALPLFTSAEMGMPDDGLGRVHTKVGMNWRAIEAARAVYGGPISYFNMGIGGTTSGNTISGGRPNGAYPARLAALNAVCPAGTMDVCVIGFGMNQPESTDTDNDLVAIAAAIRAVHPNVTLVFCAPAKPNELYRPGAHWLLQARQVEWAADHVGAAYIDVAAVWGASGKPGTIGVPGGFENSTTYVNHPGLKELEAMGDLLVQALLP